MQSKPELSLQIKNVKFDLSISHETFMKNILATMIILCVVCILHAQTFEGTITWTFKSDIKLSGDQHEKMMEAKKQFEQQMSNPEFKKQLEQNPKLKEMMEQQMKAFENMENGSPLLPEKMVVKIKGNNSRTIMNEYKEILFIGTERKTYELNPKNKTYSEIPDSKATNENMPEISVTKGNETATIAGHSCQKYIVSFEGKGRAEQVNQFIWATKDLAGLDPLFFEKSSRGNQNMKFYFEKIEGIPLRIETKTPEGSLLIEVSEIKKSTLPESDFKIPAEFRKI